MRLVESTIISFQLFQTSVADHRCIMPSTPALTFSTSNKHNQILICDGFVYHLNRTRPKMKYWRCKVRTCSAYIHTDHNDQYLGKSGEHDGHLPNPENIEIASFRHKLKERVINETTAIGKIYETELAAAGLSEAALVMTPSADEASMKSFLSDSFSLILINS